MSTPTGQPYTPQKLPLKKLRPSRYKKELHQAHKALAHYRHLLTQSPHITHLLSGFLVTESLASLEAKKIHPTIQQFLTSVCKQTKELHLIEHYYTALKKSCLKIPTHAINSKLLHDIHRIIKKDAPKQLKPGAYRTQQNWIGKEGCPKEDAYFFPPKAKEMRIHLHNLFAYLHKKHSQPLVQIAILTAQFLIIHPFMDGNGRLARILSALLLYKKQLLPHPLLFLSRYFKDNRRMYFQKLFDITSHQEWEQWIQFFLKGVTREAKASAAKATRILHLYENLQLAFPHPRALLYLFEHPVFSASTFIKKFSQRDLKKLKLLNVIKPTKDRHYIFPQLIKILKINNKK